MASEEEASALSEQKENDRTLSSTSLPLLRHCTFVLNHLYSYEDCFPFISPVPAAAEYYYQRITQPMDLSTIESNLHRHHYHSFADFEHDLKLIWHNAKQFHLPSDTLYKQADHLYNCYMELPAHIRTDPSALSTFSAIPEEAGPAPALMQGSSQLYFTQVVGETEANAKALRGFSKTRDMYNQLNAPFFRAMDAFKATGHVDGPWPRLYISQNRTLMTEACESNAGVMAVLGNVDITPCTDPVLHARRLFHFKGDVVLTEPMRTCHDVQIAELGHTEDFKYHAKGWIKLRILKVALGVETLVTSAMEKNFFRRAFSTHRVSTLRKSDLKKAGDADGIVITHFIKSVLSTVSNTDLPPALKAYPIEPPVDAKPASTPPYVPFKKRVAMMSKERAQSDRGDTPNKSRKRSSDDSPIHHRRLLDDDTSDDKDPSVEGSSSSASATPPSTLNGKSSLKESPSSQDPSSMAFRRYLDPDETTETTTPLAEDSATREYYIEKAKQLWDKVFQLCEEKGVGTENIKKYMTRTSAFPNAEGYFKHVYYVKDDDRVVVQTFRRMTLSQRTIELASLLALHGLPHMGQIVEVLQEDKGEIIGLAMERYETTLKQYTHAHSHHHLSSYQKMDLVEQMLKCMDTIHSHGLAHRDLSELNFMVNEHKGEYFEDGSARATLYLIDFGKATFVHPEHARHWWTEHPRVDGEYDGEIVPQTEAELEEWCSHLPWVKAKPDHGYRHYRSIQTLPRSRTDTELLPWRIHPVAEDMYSIGAIIWKVFAETEPWHGILDTDLKGLRETVQHDERIQQTLEREVAGQLSRELLLSCLRVDANDRKSAAEILTWLTQPNVRQGLMEEWRSYSPTNRRKRHAKAAFEFEDEQARQFRRGRRGRPRGRPPLHQGPVSDRDYRPPGRPRGTSSSGSRYVPTGRPRGRPRGSGRRLGGLLRRPAAPETQPALPTTPPISEGVQSAERVQSPTVQDASTQTSAGSLLPLKSDAPLTTARSTSLSPPQPAPTTDLAGQNDV